jgi:hypothetical protein
MIRSVAPEVLPFRISSLGRFSGAHMIGPFDGTVASSTAVWPAANRALYMPIYLPVPFKVARFWVQNGSNTTGNIDVGLLDANGNKLISTGSTARSGATTTQYIGVTDASFGAGTYYLALVMDNTTGSVTRLAAGSLSELQIGGMFQESSAFALPGTATFAQIASNYAPYFGFSQSDTF